MARRREVDEDPVVFAIRDRRTLLLAAISAVMGKLPTPEEYLEYANQIDSMAPEIYDYLNFDQVPEFLQAAEQGKSIAKEIVVEA